jgi:hypothetical protein
MKQLRHETESTGLDGSHSLPMDIFKFAEFKKYIFAIGENLNTFLLVSDLHKGHEQCWQLN